MAQKEDLLPVSSPPEPRVFIREMLRVFVENAPNVSEQTLRELDYLASNARKSHRFQLKIARESEAATSARIKEQLSAAQQRVMQLLAKMNEMQKRIDNLEEELSKKNQKIEMKKEL